VSVAKSVPRARLNSQTRLFSGSGHNDTKREDVLRRFTSTPHVTDLRLMERTVRLETNSEALLDLAVKFFERHQDGIVKAPEFLWRIVCESDPEVTSTAVQFSAFSDMGLRYVNVGQRGFLAVDLEAREAVGNISKLYLESKPGLRNCRTLDILFCMTAPSLGLTALSGGCVGLGDRGVMVFGPPDSGKTTACYLAAMTGMEFQADHLIFLDACRMRLRAWGDLLPAVFRPDALEHLPELRDVTHRSAYKSLPFYYLDKAPFQSKKTEPISPVCSIFLERGAVGKPETKKLEPDEVVRRLGDCLLFQEDERFRPQTLTALNAVAERPAYHLRYQSDPKVPASFIETLLR